MSPRQRFQARRTPTPGLGPPPCLGRPSCPPRSGLLTRAAPGLGVPPARGGSQAPIAPGLVSFRALRSGLGRRCFVRNAAGTDSSPGVRCGLAAYARAEGVPAGLSAGLSPAPDSEGSRTPRVTHPGRPEELFWERKAHSSRLNSWSPSPGFSGCARGAVPGRAVDSLQLGTGLLLHSLAPLAICHLLRCPESLVGNRNCALRECVLGAGGCTRQGREQEKSLPTVFSPLASGVGQRQPLLNAPAQAPPSEEHHIFHQSNPF